MDILEKICEMSRRANPRIVLAEGEDPRVSKAALKAMSDGLATISLVADPERIGEHIRKDITESGIEIHDPKDSSHFEEYSNTFLELRKDKGISANDAKSAMLKNTNFAAMMVRKGDADGTIAGAVATSADTIRSALQIVGKSPNSKIVSSYFLMVLPYPHSRPVVFADCALVATPDADQLADIALSSAASFEGFVGETPRIAMLSFSTKGSASHDSISTVRNAVEIAKSKSPSLAIEGEIQFDAAIDMNIQRHKAPDSILGGVANVFIFPDLNSGNIGYKIAQSIGGAKALGPILQGLSKPANDLSRGCSTNDVYNLIAITAVQAGRQ